MFIDFDAGSPSTHRSARSSHVSLDDLVMVAALHHDHHSAVTSTLRLLRQQGFNEESLLAFFEERGAQPNSAFWQGCEKAMEGGVESLRAYLSPEVARA